MAKTVLKWMKRIALGLIVLIIFLGLLGMTYQAAATNSDQNKFPPPGQRVDIGGYKLHIYCLGTGSPTAILDSANMGTVSNWAWIQQIGRAHV